LVNAPQEKAFRVFTEKIDAWWPRKHHIGKSPLREVVLESKPGGRWYARHEDGSETNTGKVLVWDPPGRVVLGWQLTADWQFDPSFVTEVEVTFVADGPDRTWVALEHRDLDRFGEKAQTVRNGIGSAQGWPFIIDEYARVAAS
jgi:hypothetical protein